MPEVFRTVFKGKYKILVTFKWFQSEKTRIFNACTTGVKEGFGAMILINIRDLNIEYGLFLVCCTQAIDLA